jgi:uncharacterized protein (TIGR00251 family)
MLYKIHVEFRRDFVEVTDNKIKIGIRTKPIKGEANKEIVKKISKHFGISSSLVKIRFGHKSKQKIVEIQDQIS